MIISYIDFVVCNLSNRFLNRSIFLINLQSKFKRMIKYSLLLITSITLFGCSNAQTEEQVVANKKEVKATTVNAETFKKDLEQPDIVILDVRTAGEYESGHINHALQADWTNQSEFKERVKAIDKNAPIYIYCLGGGRSAAAQNYLVQNGFTNITNLQGGINAWNQAGYPTVGTTNVTQISLKEYEASIPKEGTVLVDFSAEWCPPCKKVEPIVKSLEEEGTQVIRIDGGNQKELCKAMQISGFPTLIIYKNGKESARKTGLISEAALKALLQ